MLYLRHSASVWTPTSWQRKKKCVQLPKPSVTLSAISKGRISSQSMMTGVSEVTDFMTIDFNLQVEMRINNIRGKIIYFYMQIDLKYLYLCREIWGRVYFFTWKFQIGFKNSYFKDKMILSLFCNFILCCLLEAHITISGSYRDVNVSFTSVLHVVFHRTVQPDSRSETGSRVSFMRGHLVPRTKSLIKNPALTLCHPNYYIH